MDNPAKLVGLHTRIPEDLKEDLDWILYIRKQKMTDAVTEAIQDWVAKERAAQPIPERPARTSMPAQSSERGGA